MIRSIESDPIDLLQLMVGNIPQPVEMVLTSNEIAIALFMGLPFLTSKFIFDFLALYL